MSKKTKVGVVGVGYLGQIHAKIYSEMDNVELVMLADTDRERGDALALKYGCAATTSFLDLIDQVDAVSIVVPTSLHYDVAQPFLEAGIATLMEKPIAATVDEARKLVDLAAQNDAPFLIGHLERYNPALRAVAEKVADPKYIEVHRLGTFVERATDVDVITDLMIHDLDLVLSLVDEEPNDVQAIGASVVTSHVDLANVRLGFPSGAVANITASRVSNKRFRRFRVFGPEGYYGINLMDQELDIVTKGVIPVDEAFAKLEVSHKKFENEQPLQVELAHFIDVAQRLSMPMVTGLQGLRALQLAEQIQSILRASNGPGLV
ncbi:MAG TPA: gfo/Idh/MocA family oxidoreductase [Gammaproteobacteria bacterium]|jgi:predicted dehydrogenase|nr:gfo/Idh/MocA family oxidoreductase [Gammaproteobacteria bacterium]